MSEGMSDSRFMPSELLVTHTEKNNKPVDVDEKQKNLEERRDKCFERLQDIGIISRVHNNQGEELIVLENLDFFTKGRYSGYDRVEEKRIELSAKDIYRMYCNKIYLSEKFGEANVAKTLFFLFKDTNVITREDANAVSLTEGGNWTKKDVPAKDLFYLPTSKEDVFDLEKVRNSEYYFLLPQICSRWITTYPTRREGFDSGLNSVETAFTAMIYNNGRGLRNSEGVLMVDNEVNKDSKRRPISVLWFKNNFASKFLENETPKGVLAKYGENLVKNKLLLEADFREIKKKEGKDTVTKLGSWYDSGVVYYVGKKMKGCSVERLSENVVMVIDNDGDIKKMFNPNLDERARSGLNPYYTHTGVLVTQVPESVMRGAEINQGKMVSLYRFDMDGKRYIDEEKLATLGPRLIDFFNLTDMDSKTRKDLKLEEAMAVLKQYESLDENSKGLYLKLIKDHGPVAFKFLADRYVSGGISVESLLLAEAEKSETEKLLEGYVEAMDNLEKIRELVKTKDEMMKYYFDRLINSFKHGSWGIIKAGALVDLNKSSEQMNLMAKSFHVLNELWSGSETDWVKDELCPNKGAVVVFYKNKDENDKSKFRMIFRPKMVDNDVNGKSSQARWAVTYTDNEGKEISYKLDLDEFGVSFDLGRAIYVNGGRKMGELQELLKTVGYEYHIQKIINKATFKKSNVFAKFIGSVADMTNLSLNDLELPA